MNRLISLALLGLCMLTGLLVAACTPDAVRSKTPDALVIFPPPPDTTRIQYLTHFSTSEDVRGKRGGFHRYIFGEEEPMGIIKPYGITVRGSKVYICDTGLAGLVVLDLAERTFENFIPGGKGQLQLPINSCLDDSGNLYVADANRGQVVVFDSDLNYISAFGEPDSFRPTDVVVEGDRIFVANVHKHAIFVYRTETFEFLERLSGSEAEGNGYLRQPTNVSLQNGNLYVSDFGDFNVKRFTQKGDFTGTIGGYGNGPGRFTRPKGIALDRDENLYVVDAAFDNVQIFDPAGNLLLHFGGSYKGPGAMWLPAAVEISYEHLSYFEPYVDDSFDLKYLIYVTNQYGPAKVNIYGFVEPRSTRP